MRAIHLLALFCAVTVIQPTLLHTRQDNDTPYKVDAGAAPAPAPPAAPPARPAPPPPPPPPAPRPAPAPAPAPVPPARPAPAPAPALTAARPLTPVPPSLTQPLPPTTVPSQSGYIPDGTTTYSDGDGNTGLSRGAGLSTSSIASSILSTAITTDLIGGTTSILSVIPLSTSPSQTSSAGSGSMKPVRLLCIASLGATLAVVILVLNAP